MPRYIDAEVALQSFCAECNHTIKCEDCDIKYHLLEFVPTVEKRGRWRKINMIDAHGNYAVVQCTACKALYGLPTFYCPNCGAKMDEVDE